MTDEQNEIDQFVKRVVKACKRVVHERDGKPAPPRRLYHFTDGGGFNGIVTSHCLWLSLATALNDAKEISHGIEIAKGIAAGRLSKGATPYDEALAKYLNQPAWGSRHLDAPPFVLSFYDRIDRADQWLHYGRSGTGVALGFATAHLRGCEGCSLVKINYDLRSQRSWLKRLIEAGCSALSASGPHRKPDIAAQIVATYVLFLAAQMKHRSFRDDNEWRLFGGEIRAGGELQGPSLGRAAKSRSNGATIVPYRELSLEDRRGRFKRGVLKDVVVGYSSALDFHAVRLLLSEQGVRPSVRRSDVPVR